MQRLLIAAVVGLLAGVATTAWLTRLPQSTNEPVRRDIVVAATVTEREVERHRRDRFARIESIEQVVALPGTFARAEALYALAGRSDSPSVQGLLFDANRIADRDVRRGLLTILLERLTELDPASALVLTRAGHLAHDRKLERDVWNAWARRDLDAAIAAANALPSRLERDRAAQAMFAAHGYQGNAAVERIERETGIRPSVQTLTEYLHELADMSVADAVHYIDTEVAADRQIPFTRRLAAHLASANPARAAGFATLFRDESLRREFSTSVTREHAALDPDAYLVQLMPGGTRPDDGTVRVVIGELLERDLEAAMDIVGRLAAQKDREWLGVGIAGKLAERDAMQALDWARSQPGSNAQLIGTVLAVVARDDGDLAVELAEQIDNRVERQQAMMRVISSLAARDPAKAASLTLAMEDSNSMGGMLPHLVMRWMQVDRDAALAWIGGLEPRQRADILGRGGAQVADRDPELAIGLLPSLDGEAAAELRRNIVARLAAAGAISRAQELIARMPSGEDADSLRAALAGGVAQHDVVHAQQLVEQIADPRARDNAYVNLVRTRGLSDPVAALGMLTAIGDERLRANAVARPISEWYRRDTQAAEQWLATQPRGTVRDSAIAAVAGQWVEPSARQQRLLASIENDDYRHSAYMRQLYAVAGRDPARAQALLDTLDLPQKYRDDLQRFLDRQTAGSWYVR